MRTISIAYMEKGISNSYTVSAPLHVKDHNIEDLLKKLGADHVCRFDFLGSVDPKQIKKGPIENGETYMLSNFDEKKLHRYFAKNRK